MDSLLAQAGVVPTDTLGELLHAARLLVDQPLPQGNRVGNCRPAYGLNVLAADAAEVGFGGLVVADAAACLTRPRAWAPAAGVRGQQQTRSRRVESRGGQVLQNQVNLELAAQNVGGEQAATVLAFPRIRHNRPVPRVRDGGDCGVRDLKSCLIQHPQRRQVRRVVVAAYWPERVERITGVTVAEQRAGVRLLAGAERAMVLTARDAEQHSKGVDTVSGLINLASRWGCRVPPPRQPLHRGWPGGRAGRLPGPAARMWLVRSRSFFGRPVSYARARQIAARAA